MISKADRWIEYRRGEALEQAKQYGWAYGSLHYQISVSHRIKRRTNYLTIYKVASC